jgi:hypothetical protein
MRQKLPRNCNKLKTVSLVGPRTQAEMPPPTTHIAIGYQSRFIIVPPDANYFCVGELGMSVM